MADLRVGIIGYGAMGQAHAEVWSQMPDTKVVAIADVDPVKLAQAKEKLDCSTYPDGQAMFMNESLAIVVVATHMVNHYVDAFAAIHGGCDVICEKPFTSTLRQADDLIRAANRTGVHLAVHHQMAFSDAVAKADEMLQDGVVGDLYFMESISKGRLAPYELMEMAMHNLHLMYHFAGEPWQVFGHVREREGHDSELQNAFLIKRKLPEGRDCGMGMGYFLQGYYKFNGGVSGSLRLAGLPKADNEYAGLILYGTEGRLRIHNSGGGRLYFSPNAQDTFSSQWQEVDNERIWRVDFMGKIAMSRFVEDFTDVVKIGGKPMVCGEVGRLVLEMAHGIYASHLAGRPLSFPLENREHPLM